MLNKPADGNRRRLLKLGVLGIAATPVLGRLVLAQEAQPVEETDAVAQQLSYKHDADQATDPKREPGQTCANCQLYQVKDGGEWGGCPLFQEKLVNAKGWCNAWVPKAG